MSTANAEGLTDRQVQLLAVAWASIATPTVVVALRMWARRLLRASLWWDDYLVVLALVGMHRPGMMPPNRVTGVVVWPVYLCDKK